MAEIRETEVERDADGRVVAYKERVSERGEDRVVRRRGGGFGWGMLLGMFVLAVAIIAFAYNQGSFQQAGVEADQATAQIEQQTETVAENTGDVLETAGDQAEQATN